MKRIFLAFLAYVKFLFYVFKQRYYWVYWVYAVFKIIVPFHLIKKSIKNFSIAVFTRIKKYLIAFKEAIIYYSFSLDTTPKLIRLAYFWLCFLCSLYLYTYFYICMWFIFKLITREEEWFMVFYCVCSFFIFNYVLFMSFIGIFFYI
jgi:hypothetical protein